MAGSATVAPFRRLWTVSADFDLARELESRIGDRRGVWEFVREFAAAWSTPLCPEDGCCGGDLMAAERRLGLRLPVAVWEAYALFGRRRDLTSNQDSLDARFEWYVDRSDAVPVLVYRTENQGACVWGVRLVDFDGRFPLEGQLSLDFGLVRKDAGVAASPDDPPVVVETGNGWRPYLDRFSVACVEMLLWESLSAVKDLYDFQDLSEETSIATLEQRYTPLALPAYSIYDGQSMRWFSGPDAIICLDGRRTLWVRARTRTALDSLRQELPGPWLTVDLQA